MISTLYRYRFRAGIDLKEVEDTLRLAFIAAEGIFGQARVRMDTACAVDATINVIVVDASSLIGQVVGAIFTAFITHEFGQDGFSIRRVEGLPGQTLQEAGR